MVLGTGDAGEIAEGGGQSLGSYRNPVSGVSWYDVLKWCNALSELQGLVPVYTVSGGVYRTGQPDPASVVANAAASGFRLPSMAEWEWAARAGDNGPQVQYAWGREWTSRRSNTMPTVDSFSEGSLTVPVGSYPSGTTGWGAYEMTGNVWEWCFGIAGTLQSAKGGGFGTPLSNSSLSSTIAFDPSHRNGDVGLRVIRN